MEFPSSDADLRAHAEFSAIRKLGRRVVQRDGTVDSVQKLFSCFFIICDDGIRMFGAVTVNMINCLI